MKQSKRVHGLFIGPRGGKYADPERKSPWKSPDKLKPHPKPTPKQAEAGNYKKHHVRFAGLDVSVENPAGSYREGVSAEGVPWRTLMRNHYGYVRGTLGHDGDQVDVFIGPDPEAECVYVVHQLDPVSRSYDEDKCMVGFPSEEAAKAAYCAHYDTPAKFFGGITVLSLPDFKAALARSRVTPEIVIGAAADVAAAAGPRLAPIRLQKSGGPYLGPRGGKWANPEHTIPWEEPKAKLHPPRRVPVPERAGKGQPDLFGGQREAQRATTAKPTRVDPRQLDLFSGGGKPADHAAPSRPKPGLPARQLALDFERARRAAPDQISGKQPPAPEQPKAESVQDAPVSEPPPKFKFGDRVRWDGDGRLHTIGCVYDHDPVPGQQLYKLRDAETHHEVWAFERGLTAHVEPERKRVSPDQMTGEEQRQRENAAQASAEARAKAPDHPPPEQRDWRAWLAQVRDINRRAVSGEATAGDLHASYVQWKQHADRIKAELAKMTVKELTPFAGWHARGMRKEQLVSAAYNILLEHHMVGSDGYAFMVGTESVESARDREMAKITDASLSEFRKDLAARKAAKEAKLAEHRARIEHPQTADDWALRAKHVGGYDKLSPEERQAHDEAHGAKVREAREAELAERAQRREGAATPPSGSGAKAEVIAGTHTKKGHPIWTVRLGERVGYDDFTRFRNAAKAAGGYYSSFRGGGAVPGFIFDNADTAQRFAAGINGSEESRSGSQESLEGSQASEESRTGSQESLEGSQESRRQDADRLHGHSHDRLRELAATMRDKAEAELGADRRENTNRRAAMAQGIRSRARGQIEHANVLEKIAHGLTDGTLQHLWGVRHSTHVEELDDLLGRAKHARAKAEGGDDYRNWEKTRERDAELADVDHARWPAPRVSRSGLRDVIEAARRARMRVPARVAALAETRDGEWETAPLSNQDIDEVAEFARKVAQRVAGGRTGWSTPGHTVLANLQQVQRLRAMGIESEPQLRAALREYLQVSRGAARAPEEDHVRNREGEFARANIPGYFPTPASVVQKMLRAADIKPGESVLEPSAGAGHIADAATAAGGDVTALEIHEGMRDHLANKGHRVAGADALEYRGQHDKIVMNPPFEHGQDIDHVRQAFEHNLKPGGRVVAIMSEGPFYRGDKHATGFRDWLASVGGRSEKLPDGSFMASDRQTGVATRMVTIDKPHEAAPAQPRAHVRRVQREQSAPGWHTVEKLPDGSEYEWIHGRKRDADANAEHLNALHVEIAKQQTPDHHTLGAELLSHLADRNQHWQGAIKAGSSQMMVDDVRRDMERTGRMLLHGHSGVAGTGFNAWARSRAVPKYADADPSPERFNRERPLTREQLDALADHGRHELSKWEAARKGLLSQYRDDVKVPEEVSGRLWGHGGSKRLYGDGYKVVPVGPGAPALNEAQIRNLPIRPHHADVFRDGKYTIVPHGHFIPNPSTQAALAGVEKSLVLHLFRPRVRIAGLRLAA